MLTKEDCIWERDETGKIIEQKVICEELNKEVIITPLLAGEWKRIRQGLMNRNTVFTDEDEDIEIITTHLKQPELTKEEIKKMKPFVRDAIVNTIFENSGLTNNKEEKEADIKKSGETNEKSTDN